MKRIDAEPGADGAHGIGPRNHAKVDSEPTGVLASMNGANSAGLTGVWLGLYSYPRRLEPVRFTATLIETSGAISGSSHETPGKGMVPPRILFAALCGRRSDSKVEFVKTYDDGIPHSHPINYEGEIRDGGSEIEGRWIIPRSWSGRFLMIRSAPNAEKIVRKKYEGILI